MKKPYIIILGTLFLVAILWFFSSQDFFDKLGTEGGVGDLGSTTSSSLVNKDIANNIDTFVSNPNSYTEYKNNKYSFSFRYPPQVKIKEFEEGQGAMTITVENKQNVRGLQIFIVPYHEKTISDKRFKLDVPSGVRTDIVSSLVDGVEAVTFNSYDQYLGPTREIWIIRGGYLYEVTTFQGVDDWFTPIINTWKFY